jgi:hypothetical protein
VKPEAQAVRAALAARLDLEALYLCGPFDSSGEPASPDVHMLAVVRPDEVRDLHLVPGVARFERRVEVSVVPCSLLEGLAAGGASSWLGFYTADKIAKARVILESDRAADLRRQIAAGLRLRPSFYAAAVRNVVAWAARAKDAPPAGPTRLAAASSLLLASLGLHLMARPRLTFTKQSEVVSRSGSLLRGCDAGLALQDKAAAAEMLRAASGFLRLAFGREGIDPEKIWERLA